MTRTNKKSNIIVVFDEIFLQAQLRATVLALITVFEKLGLKDIFFRNG